MDEAYSTQHITTAHVALCQERLGCIQPDRDGRCLCAEQLHDIKGVLGQRVERHCLIVVVQGDVHHAPGKLRSCCSCCRGLSGHAADEARGLMLHVCVTASSACHWQAVPVQHSKRSDRLQGAAAGGRLVCFWGPQGRSF
jgi:hypothetical protein